MAKEACEVLEELAVIGEAALHAKEAVGNNQRLKADDDSSTDESGNDGDKDVREYLEDREELALLVRLGALDLGSADLLNARQSHKLIVAFNRQILGLLQTVLFKLPHFLLIALHCRMHIFQHFFSCLIILLFYRLRDGQYLKNDPNPAL